MFDWTDLKKLAGVISEPPARLSQDPDMYKSFFSRLTQSETPNTLPWFVLIGPSNFDFSAFCFLNEDCSHLQNSWQDGLQWEITRAAPAEDSDSVTPAT